MNLADIRKVNTALGRLETMEARKLQHAALAQAAQQVPEIDKVMLPFVDTLPNVGTLNARILAYKLACWLAQNSPPGEN